MSVRRCFFILFAVASQPFLEVLVSSSVASSTKIEADMNSLGKDQAFKVIPTRSNGAKSSDWQPTQINKSMGKITRENNKETAVGHFSENNLLGLWNILDNTARVERIQRGAEEANNVIPPRDRSVPSPNQLWMLFCLIPEDGLKTAEILCTRSPRMKTCISYCASGYTYEDGIARTSECYFMENKWSREFEECKPFVDCRLKMKTSGTLNCITNELKNRPRCEIECDLWDENDPVPKQNFTCDIDGSWDPFLPHCVEPTDKILVDSPGKLHHDDILYPTL